MDENELSREIIGAAIEVHQAMGPGLLESVYRQCLVRELTLRGIDTACEVPLTANYKGLAFDSAYRIDMLAGGTVIVELKTVERILDVHEAQLLSYLRLTGLKLGLLINFHVSRLKTGVRRIVNGL
jgi:GxxExxY protein